ncbi:MAG: 30S ribosome-binding factor RbfA [Alphaproteobacteria bacterium]|nr:30S ribosome-binding factor RbfA [Alphaproteobacteria bacterium]OJV45368.1 MAG: ribosome-binding factor A [Alphaproteobacteria bacterium 43-37]
MALSTRQLKVGELVKRILATNIHDLEFYKIDPMSVSVMEVKMSPDLRHAHVYLSIHAAEEPEKILTAFNALAPVIQKKIAVELRLKFTPKMRFILDTTLEQSWKIDQLLNN